MDFLNKGYAQLADLFRQMTPAARITAGLLFVGIVVSLVYLFGFKATAADEYMFAGQDFSQRDIGMMEAAFSKARLNDWQTVGYRIKVPRGLRDSYYKALVENDAMPESLVDATSEAIKKDNAFSSGAQRSAILKHATEQQLAKVISSFKGIEKATVLYDESPTSSFSRNKERSALVAVKANGNRSLDDDEIKAIRSAVQRGIGNLPIGNIAVTDLNAGRSYSGSDDGRLNSGDNVYAANKRELEKLYKGKIEASLGQYPGVIVAVNVELDPELSHTVLDHKLQGKPVPFEKSTTVKETPISQATNSGPPGAATNGVGNAPRAIRGGDVAATEKAIEERSQEKLSSSQTQITSQKAPLVPKHIAATIALPTSYFENVWKERNPVAKGDKDKTPDPADLKKIEEEIKKSVESTVVPLLTLDANIKPLVSVTSFLELPSPPLEKPSVAETASTWLAGNWQTVGMLLLGLVSLLFLRGMVRSTPSRGDAMDAAAAAVTPLKIADVEEEENAAPAATKPRRRFKSSGTNLRAELTDLVKEDPDTAANILRNWIGEVA